MNIATCIRKIDLQNIYKYYLIVFVLTLNFGCNTSPNITITQPIVEEVFFNNNKRLFTKNVYNIKSNQIKERMEFSNSKEKIENKTQVFYFLDGNISKIYSYEMSQPFGEQMEYYANGQLKIYFFSVGDNLNCRTDFDTSGKLIKRQGNLLYWIYKRDRIQINEYLTGLLYLTFPEDQFSLELINNGDTSSYDNGKLIIEENAYGRFARVNILSKKPGLNTIKFKLKVFEEKRIVTDSLSFNFDGLKS